MKKILIFIITAFFFIGCGKERYAEINTDPKSGTADISFLFASAQANFEEGDDDYWAFYASYHTFVYPFAQITIQKNSALNTIKMFELPVASNPFGGEIYDKGFGGNIKHLQNLITKLPEREKVASTYIAQMAQLMYIHHATLSADYGEIIYKEANKGLYTVPPLLILKYETQEELYDVLDAELKAAIDTLSSPLKNSAGEDVTPYNMAIQDVVYQGDVQKWIKFANGIRLKIALRLLHGNFEKGKKIAEEVFASGNYMTSYTEEYRQVYVLDEYGAYGSNYKDGLPTSNFIDMLKDAMDPRLRFFHHKNGYNPGVVQGMLDQGKTFPDFIANEMIVEDGEFIRWKSKAMGDGDQYMGEPWVRYHGRTPMHDSELSQEFKDSYTNEQRFQVDINDDVKRTFFPHSTFNDQLVTPDNIYKYPSLQEVQDEYKPAQRYNSSQVIYSAAEGQLILALYGVYGANISNPAALYQSAIENSVRSYDFSVSPAHLNALYYDSVYDETTFTNQDGAQEVIEKSIGLKSGEIDNMFTLPANQLIGTTKEQLEKCFIQLTINAFRRAHDINIYTKFGGIPMKGSNVWPRVNFLEDESLNTNLNIPRRLPVGEPLTNDQNYENYTESLARQGITDYVSPSPPMADRYCADKNSPAWGEGPIVK